MITLKINGTSQEVDVEPDMPLLWVLRDEVGLKGTKFGCGAALCGACTVHVEGRATRSCSVPVSAVGGQDGDDHRGPRATGCTASGAAGVDRAGRCRNAATASRE